jgi:LacI family transcriptional regulator
MPKRVALVISPYGQDFLKGIAQYVQSHHDWDCAIVSHWQEDHEDFRVTLREWPCDGLIVQLFSDDFARLLMQASMPVVNVSSYRSDWPFLTVMEDNHAIGQMAGRYFAERGYRQFAYIGETEPAYSRWRREGFLAEVKRQGFETPKVFEALAFVSAEHGDALTAWLDPLPKPLAVLTSNDVMARQVTRALLKHGIAVPEQVAVMGVDNDVATCELLTVPITSIDRNAEPIGYEAARALDGLMSGEPSPESPILVPPKGVVERGSTQQLAVDDPELGAALRYIREHLDEASLTIEDVAAAAGLSQRSLERRFRKLLGRTPRRELIRCRLDRAARLLRETDLNLDGIAEASGFADSTYLCRSFKQDRDLTPIEYRKHHRMI